MRWPDNPISKVISAAATWPIKRIVFARPDVSVPSAIMAWIKWDSALSVRDPRMDSHGVTVQGWERMADTYILIDEIFGGPEQIEDYISELGWALGAGYMYRWHKAPGHRREHLWGTERYTVMGQALSMGDSDDELANLCERHGVWEWEINCAWRKNEGSTSVFFASWRKDDPTLTDDGSRGDAPWPGWGGTHPFLRSNEPGHGYESHYFLTRPKRINKHTDVLRRELINDNEN